MKLEVGDIVTFKDPVRSMVPGDIRTPYLVILTNGNRVVVDNPRCRASVEKDELVFVRHDKVAGSFCRFK